MYTCVNAVAHFLIFLNFSLEDSDSDSESSDSEIEKDKWKNDGNQKGKPGVGSNQNITKGENDK